MNKKAGIMDMFLYIIIAFIMIICSVLLVYMAGQVKHTFDTNDMGLHSDQSKIVNETFGNVLIGFNVLPWALVFLMVGMGIAILVSSYFTQTSPVYFVPYIIIMIILVIVSVPIANSYETLYSNADLSSTFIQFFAVSYIFTKLPIWVSVIGILAGIVMYIRMFRNYGGADG